MDVCDKFRKILLSCCAGLLLCAFMLPAMAQNKHIYDYAKVLDVDILKQYDDLLNKIETENKFRIEAVILPEFGNDPQENTINYFITELSNRQPAVDYSALLFVVLNDRHASIHTSSNIGNFYTTEAQEEIIGKVQTEINQKNYQKILKEGIGGIVYYFNRNINKPAERTLWDMALDNFVLIGLMVIFLLIISFSRKKNKQQ